MNDALTDTDLEYLDEVAHRAKLPNDVWGKHPKTKLNDAQWLRDHAGAIAAEIRRLRTAVGVQSLPSSDDAVWNDP